jgi:hypothetical protein
VLTLSSVSPSSFFQPSSPIQLMEVILPATCDSIMTNVDTNGDAMDDGVAAFCFEHGNNGLVAEPNTKFCIMEPCINQADIDAGNAYTTNLPIKHDGEKCCQPSAVTSSFTCLDTQGVTVDPTPFAAADCSGGQSLKQCDNPDSPCPACASIGCTEQECCQDVEGGGASIGGQDKCSGNSLGNADVLNQEGPGSTWQVNCNPCSSSCRLKSNSANIDVVAGAALLDIKRDCCEEAPPAFDCSDVSSSDGMTTANTQNKGDTTGANMQNKGETTTEPYQCTAGQAKSTPSMHSCTTPECSDAECCDFPGQDKCSGNSLGNADVLNQEGPLGTWQVNCQIEGKALKSNSANIDVVAGTAMGDIMTACCEVATQQTVYKCAGSVSIFFI